MMEQESKSKIELSIRGDVIGKAEPTDKTDYGSRSVYEVGNPCPETEEGKERLVEAYKKMLHVFNKVEQVEYRKDLYDTRIKKHDHLYRESDGTLLLIMANVSELYGMLHDAILKRGESVDNYNFYWAPIYNDDKYPAFEYDFVWIEEK